MDYTCCRDSVEYKFQPVKHVIRNYWIVYTVEIGPLSLLPADVVSVTFPVNLVKCYGAECCRIFKHNQPSSKNIIPSTFMSGKIIY
jgi:hypothetical protein